jgi:hypothetical protein
MSWTYSVKERYEICTQNMAGKPEKKKLQGRPRHEWINYIIHGYKIYKL